MYGLSHPAGHEVLSYEKSTYECIVWQFPSNRPLPIHKWRSLNCRSTKFRVKRLCELRSSYRSTAYRPQVSEMLTCKTRCCDSLCCAYFRLYEPASPSFWYCVILLDSSAVSKFFVSWCRDWGCRGGVGFLTGCGTDWSVDHDSTEIPTTWAVNLVVAGAQVREDDRCLHVALLYDIWYKCQLNLSPREQPLLTALDVFGMGWVIKRPSQGAAAEMLPKTHDPTCSSWTLRGSLQTIFLSLSS